MAMSKEKAQERLAAIKARRIELDKDETVTHAEARKEIAEMDDAEEMLTAFLGDAAKGVKATKPAVEPRKKSWF